MKVIKAFIAGLALLGMSTPAALAAGGAKHPSEGKGELPEWEFEGIFGKFDKKSVQRGFQVYEEVCAACHGMELLSYRNLGEPGGPYDKGDAKLTEQAVKAFAESKIVEDIDDFGDVIERPGRPADRFVSPYPNKQAAAAANGGAIPPDFSVIVKARPNGVDYIYRLMTGYPSYEDIHTDDEGNNIIHFDDEHTHGDLTQPVGLYYNPYFPGDVGANFKGDPRHKPYGGFIAMPPQLSDDRVEYSGKDAPEASKEQIAKDVVTFLAWASEPKMENRKQLGVGVMIYLFLLALLVYFSYKQIWRNVEH